MVDENKIISEVNEKVKNLPLSEEQRNFLAKALLAINIADGFEAEDDLRLKLLRMDHEARLKRKNENN